MSGDFEQQRQVHFSGPRSATSEHLQTRPFGRSLTIVRRARGLDITEVTQHLKMVTDRYAGLDVREVNSSHHNRRPAVQLLGKFDTRPTTVSSEVLGHSVMRAVPSLLKPIAGVTFTQLLPEYIRTKGICFFDLYTSQKYQELLDAETQGILGDLACFDIHPAYGKEATHHRKMTIAFAASLATSTAINAMTEAINDQLPFQTNLLAADISGLVSLV